MDKRRTTVSVETYVYVTPTIRLVTISPWFCMLYDFFSVYEEDPDLNNEMEVSVSTCGVSDRTKLGY